MIKGTKINVIAWAAAAVLLAAVILLNMVFSKVDVSLDVTPYNAYTLSDQADEVLSSMEKPVDMYVLYKLDDLYEGVSPGEQEYMMVDMFVKTVRQMDKFDKITLHEVDIVQDPDFVDEVDPEGLMNLSSADVVLKCGDSVRDVAFLDLFKTNEKTSSIEFYGENMILSAVNYLETGITPTVYFTTGHGEKAIEKYSSIIRTLRTQNYAAEALDIAQKGSVPGDATTLVIAAPKEDISDKERDIILDYMAQGGNVTLLMSPNEEKMVYSNIEKIMDTYKIAMDYNKVFETANEYFVEDDKYTVYCNFTDIDFNQGLINTQGDVQLIMPPSRSFYSTADEDDESGITVEPLIETFNTAQSEVCGGTDKDAMPPAGMLYLAAYGEDPSRNNSKIFVCGSADFIDDDTGSEIYLSLSHYLFLTTISWMDTQNTEMIYPTRIAAADYISIPDTKTGNIILVIMIAFPVAIALTGVLIWNRRRHA
ncbi:MAG: GldG family protein [Oscillospiraceae bacterium]|nr:GldG family protein [Oscillospiraceae bacterium]